MSELASQPRSNSELLWEFDRELAAGHEPAWNAILQHASDEDSRRELCADMIRCESSLLGWNPERLGTRLRFYAQYDPSGFESARIIRGIYADRLEAGEHPTRSEFATVGYEFDAMKLRASDDPAYLGQAIAGRLRIEERLGQGTFGVVYRATDVATERTVALKMIRVTSAERELVARTLLSQEAQLLRTLQAPGIPRFFDFLEDSEGGPALVLELVDGKSVHELRSEGPLSPERAAAIVARLAGTLQFAHRRGYLHRDLSAANILVDQHDTPYLTDFGLGVSQAELFDQERHAAGTRGYMSIESFIGATREIDARDDIWALGILLYELVTGQAAPAQTGRRALEAARNFESALVAAGATIPPPLRRICERCAADDADDRFDAAGLVARELRGYLGETLPPVDEDRVGVAQRRLWAWRAGTSFGNAYRSHAYARWRLDCLLSESAADSQTTCTATQLIFASTKTILDEFVKCTAMASRLGLTLAKITGVSEFVNVYNQNRNRPDLDTCRWLCDSLDAVGSTLFASYEQLETQLSGDGSSMIALLKLALAGGSRAQGANVPQGLIALTEAAGLPQHATARYITCVSGNPDTDEHEREVDRLRKSVERELMHGLADALGDPAAGASPRSTNS